MLCGFLRVLSYSTELYLRATNVVGPVLDIFGLSPFVAGLGAAKGSRVRRSIAGPVAGRRASGAEPWRSTSAARSCPGLIEDTAC
jgi:hypothetical protein